MSQRTKVISLGCRISERVQSVKKHKNINEKGPYTYNNGKDGLDLLQKT